MKINITRLIFGLILLIIWGCSPSSNYVRYGNDKNEEDNDDYHSSVRFTANDDSGRGSGEEIYTEEESQYNDDAELEPYDMPENEPDIDLTEVMNRFNSEESSVNSEFIKSTLREKMLMEIIRYLNTPYRYGGNTMNGIDCSAFTQTIYRNSLSIELLRSARSQFTQGVEIKDKEELQFGDLVFFNTRRRVRPGHVGIYIGDNLFAHASTKKGVTISSLDHNYYSRKYMGGRRLEVSNAF